MREDTKRQLDKLERQEKMKNIIKASCAIVALIVLISAFLIYRYSPGETVLVSGVVTGLNEDPAYRKAEIYLIVKLSNGKVVEVKKPNSVPFLKNKQVQLTETRASILEMLGMTSRHTSKICSVAQPVSPWDCKRRAAVVFAYSSLNISLANFSFFCSP